MDYYEALRFMGLEEGATEDEIKIAYREMSQILHPDRFEGNKKLQERATEQFKQLGEARDVLLSRKGRRAAASAATSAGAARGGFTGSSYNAAAGSNAAALNARLTAIASARSGVVAYKDMAEDKLKKGLVIAGIALVVGLLIGRRLKYAIPVGIILFIVGAVMCTQAGGDISAYNKQLEILDRERQECQAALDALYQ